MITVDDIVQLEQWIERGETEEVREQRLSRARERLFPPDLDRAEAERRAALIDEAKVKRAQEDEARDPIPQPVQVAADSEDEWEGIVPESSPAHRRGSRHDGTYDEVRRMRDQSRGTPFYSEDD